MKQNNNETKKVANRTLYLILLIMSFLIPIIIIGCLFFTEIGINLWHIFLGNVVSIILASISRKAYKIPSSISNVLNGVIAGFILYIYFFPI